MLLSVCIKYSFYLSLSICCCNKWTSLPSLSLCWFLFVSVSLCLSRKPKLTCSSAWVKTWIIGRCIFEFLTDSYLIFYHFILTHLPASQVAGAMDPLWLSQRNHWSSAMQPFPLRFAYRIHKQTYKDAIEVKVKSIWAHSPACTHTHKHMWVFRLVTSEILQNALLKKVSRQPHQ